MGIMLGSLRMLLASRTLQFKDLPFLRSLLEDPGVLQQTKFRIPPNLVDEDALARWAFHPSLQRYLLLADETPAGMIVLEPAGQGLAKLSYLLHASMRGLGLGKSLALEGVSVAGETGFRRVYLEATADNVASLSIIEKTVKAREFAYYEKKLKMSSDPMIQALALTTESGSKLEALPVSASDLPFYRRLFSEPDVQDQVYCAFDFLNASDESILTFLLGHSVQRWTVCLHQQGLRVPVGTIHIYERDGIFANFGLCLAKDYRNQHLGKALVTLVERAARQFGIRILRADIFLDNISMVKLAQGSGYKTFRFFEKYLYD